MATLLILARARQGTGALDLRSIARAASLTVDQAEQLLERMAVQGWVARSGGERYVMVCDKERLLVADVYREFVLDGKGAPGRARNEVMERLMGQFSARADETLNLSLGRLLEGETA